MSKDVETLYNAAHLRPGRRICRMIFIVNMETFHRLKHLFVATLIHPSLIVCMRAKERPALQLHLVVIFE